MSEQLSNSFVQIERIELLTRYYWNQANDVLIQDKISIAHSMCELILILIPACYVTEVVTARKIYKSLRKLVDNAMPREVE